MLREISLISHHFVHFSHDGFCAHGSLPSRNFFHYFLKFLTSVLCFWPFFMQVGVGESMDFGAFEQFRSAHFGLTIDIKN